jgi:FkbM family methyltransferase
MKYVILKILHSNYYFQLIASFLFKHFYFFSNKKKINIKFEKNCWIHETFFGKYAYTHPVRKAEEVLTKEFSHFIKHYSIKKGDIIFDVGAGIGTEVIFFSKLVGNLGKVYALEANPNIYKLLLKTIKLNNLKNVIPINLAVYKNSGKIIKFESDMNNWLSGKINQKYGNLSVKSITFDNLLKTINLSNIDFAKFNIEGAEKYLTIGKQKFIKVCSNVCISCHDFLENKDSHTFYEIDKMLRKNNFKIIKNKTELKSQSIDKKYFIYAKKDK